MKLRLLVLMLAAALRLSAQQTPYYPVFVEGRTWQTFFSIAGSLCNTQWGHEYFLQGDTTINGMTYHRVWSHPIRSYVLDNGGPEYCYPFYVDTSVTIQSPYYFVREDTVARRLYRYGGADAGGVDQLLFDFTLEAGDTLYTGFPLDEDVVIASIDTIVLQNGAARRRFNIVEVGNIAVIEGVGSTQSPFEPPFVPFEIQYTTACFSEGGMRLYENSDGCSPAMRSEFAPPGARWTYDQVQLVGSPPTPVHAPVYVTVVGDTTIGSRKYRVLSTGGAACTPGTLLLRQVDDKVYRRAESGADQLLYDFTLEPGDLYPVDLGFGPGALTVDSIGFTATADGQSVRTFYLGQPGWQSSIALYDGIGYDRYLVPLFDSCDYQPAGLRCYESDAAAYRFVPYDCDSTLTVAAGEPVAGISVRVWPNPFTDFLTIETADAGPMEFALFTATGQRVYRRTIDGATARVEIGRLPAGLYFWAVDGRVGGRVARR